MGGSGRQAGEQEDKQAGKGKRISKEAGRQADRYVRKDAHALTETSRRITPHKHFASILW